MRTLSVFVHFDVHGEAAPHVVRHGQALRDVADTSVVVSTADLTDEARQQLGGLGHLIERENVGYDFYSWREGLLSVPDWQDYDRIVLANDSVVGPLRPLPEILHAMDRRGADVWGATLSHQIKTHVQSFFLVFGPRVIRSSFFKAFWAGMIPLHKRSAVIQRYEIGFSHLLATAGFRLGAFFEPDGWDRRLAAIRTARVEALRSGQRPLPSMARVAVTPYSELGFDTPVFSLWDRALQHGRLPYVKLRFLRSDPYRIGEGVALRRCERQYPAEFAGVREYLRRTS